MQSVTLDSFKNGVDIRRNSAATDSKSLITGKNVHITNGMGVERRGGFRLVAKLQPNSVGLFEYAGKLVTFSGGEHNPVHGLTSSNIEIENFQLKYNGSSTSILPTEVHYAESVGGSLYVSITYDNDETEHHYIDSSAPWNVVDVNCPHTKSLVKVKDKIYAINGEEVRYTSTVNGPADWTLSSDAGFIATGRQTDGNPEVLALGEFAGQLVVFMADASQIWHTDPDPENITIDRTLRNVGCPYPKTLSPVSRDLFFLSPIGIRSIARQTYTDNLEDVDAGSPIDNLVTPLLKDMATEPIAKYFPGNGRYLCLINGTVFVYSSSRTAKISAWTTYELGFDVDYFANLGDKLYIRSGDDVYIYDEDYDYDNSEEFKWEFSLSYLSAKSPGVAKQWRGIDIVSDGTATLSHGTDARDHSQQTFEIEVSGNTRPGSLLPVEAISTAIAPKFSGMSGGGAFRLDEITYYYEHIGVFAP